MFETFDFDFKAIRGFLIDMDGVIYKSNDVIPGAIEFIELLKKKNIPFSFLTNNSQRNRRDIQKKLRYLNIHVDETHIFTCAIATARFLASQTTHRSVYFIGESGLQQALYRNGFAIDDHTPEYVVIGEGRTANMEMIDKAVQFVHRGSKLISTNPDPSCPTSDGIRAGCGAIVALIEQATGKQAFHIGKPNPIIFREARRALKLRMDQICMIGDTMETDIIGAVQMGMQSVLVLSGGTKEEDLPQFAYKPGMVIPNVASLIKDVKAMPDHHADFLPAAGESELIELVHH
ncbi:HAD-IIA family hydrolase [Kiritimatiellota bacterium B12222]|nr:HAD-IIA family hydrolase [Kiritimatiellota bacterium B12222]